MMLVWSESGQTRLHGSGRVGLGYKSLRGSSRVRSNGKNIFLKYAIYTQEMDYSSAINPHHKLSLNMPFITVY